jgi:hypothetical protein
MEEWSHTLAFVIGMDGTADPSATLRFGRDDKWKSGHTLAFVIGTDGKAGPSATLRFGRDDKSQGGASLKCDCIAEQCPGNC